MSENQKPENLDDLLDSALQDFFKKAFKSKNNKVEEAECNRNEGNKLDPNVFCEELLKLMGDDIQSLCSDMPQDPKRVLTSLVHFAEAASKSLEHMKLKNDEKLSKFSDVVSQALKSLQKGVDDLKGNLNDENDILRSFDINMEVSGVNGGNISAFFLDMIQNVISVETLRPIVNNMLEQYPEYLEENGDKISVEDKSRYEQQFELYKVLKNHLGNEKENDSLIENIEIFKQAVKDLKKLEDLGPPPEEILNKSSDFESIF